MHTEVKPTLSSTLVEACSIVAHSFLLSSMCHVTIMDITTISITCLTQNDVYARGQTALHTFCGQAGWWDSGNNGFPAVPLASRDQRRQTLFLLENNSENDLVCFARCVSCS